MEIKKKRSTRNKIITLLCILSIIMIVSLLIGNFLIEVRIKAECRKVLWRDYTSNSKDVPATCMDLYKSGELLK